MTPSRNQRRSWISGRSCNGTSVSGVSVTGSSGVGGSSGSRRGLVPVRQRNDNGTVPFSGGASDVAELDDLVERGRILQRASAGGLRPGRRRSSIFLTGSSSFLPLSVVGIAPDVVRSGRGRGGATDPERSRRPDRRPPGRRRARRRPPSTTNSTRSPGSSAPGASRWTTRLSATPSIRLDDAVDLGRPDTDTTTVERRVGPTGDDAAAPLGDRDPVAVAPDTRVVLEVRVAVPATRRRRPRSRPASTASVRSARAHPARRRPTSPSSSNAVHRCTEVAARDLALPHRCHRAPADERRAHIGAAGDRRQQRIRARRDRRSSGTRRPAAARRSNRSPRRSVRSNRSTGSRSGPLAGGEVRRSSPNQVIRSSAASRQSVVGTLVVRIAVEGDEAAAEQQPRDDVVPHHPAGRGEPEERSSASRMSPCRPITLRCSSRTPPCPWTIGFGSPVVPDEYST